MLKEIIIAFQGYYKAHQFIKEHKLWKWIIVPGIIYTLLFLVSMYFFGRTANLFIEWISAHTGLQKLIEKNENGLLGFVFAFAGVVLWIIQMLFYFSLFKYFWLIVGSPVFAFLSERTDAIMHNTSYPFSMKDLLKDILRGIRIALRNAFWQTIYMISILLLSLIPVIGWLTPLLALLVECYYYGFSMLDYSFERKKFTVAESIYFIGQHKGLAIGNGIIFYLIQIIPIIGWILAPAYSVVAATLSLHSVHTYKVEQQSA